MKTEAKQDQKVIFGKGTMSKVDACGWTVKDKPGVFMMIPKDQLHIDHDYQRNHVSSARVLAIANSWSWAALLVLGVAMRKDGTFWVFDGQHRKLGADKRSDINELPCLVFEMDDRACEAKAFVDGNTVRGPMSAYHKFRGQLMAKEPDALAVMRVLEMNGFTPGPTGGHNQVAFVAALMTEYAKDRSTNANVFPQVFALCARVCQGQAINNRLFSGLCVLQRFLEKNQMSVFDKHNVDCLLRNGQDGAVEFMNRSKNYFNAGGSTIDAQGLIRMFNHGRRSRHLPDILGGRAHENGNVNGNGEAE